MRFPAGDTSMLAREIVEESNRVISFLRDECRYTPEVTETAMDLYDAYKKWCGVNGHRALSQPGFAKQLIAAGKHFGKTITKARKTAGMIYGNLSLSTSPGGWEDGDE